MIDRIEIWLNNWSQSVLIRSGDPSRNNDFQQLSIELSLNLSHQSIIMKGDSSLHMTSIGMKVISYDMQCSMMFSSQSDMFQTEIWQSNIDDVSFSSSFYR